MNILLVEPFYVSSHKQWADGLKKYSKHNIDLLSMPGRHWKWRMHGAAVTLSQRVNLSRKSYDLILCTDMIDVGVFKSLLHKEYRDIPIVLYFHENQITYPWSENDPDVVLERNNHYGWINYTSALAADHILFNSKYHKTIFLRELPKFLSQFPDGTNESLVSEIEDKSDVAYIGIEPIKYIDRPSNDVKSILWNHRWEYDKNPILFFETLLYLRDQGLDFRLSVIGESYKNKPEIFDHARIQLGDIIDHWGYVSRTKYEEILQKADIIPVTSNQDFFGISLIEAMSAGCVPLMPKRLVFPEHLNSDYNHLYYNTEKELIEKVVHQLQANDNIRHEITRETEKYHWSTVVKEYDLYFTRYIKA